MNDDTVLFDELPTASGHRIGVATLNSEKTLNALTLPMVRRLDAQLVAWARDDGIALVVMRGAGEKAFCAGGDVRAVRQTLLEEDTHPAASAVAFFAEEYTLDYRIHTYPKPLAIWGQGIVMGGGLGLMAGASHRIVTPTTRIAMPETTIGLYPDVGGSWFLQRMPAASGLFLGLTGAPLNAHDAVLANLADHLLPGDAWPTLCAVLTQSRWMADASANRARLSQLLDTLALPDIAWPASPLAHNFQTIHRLMHRGSLMAVAEALTGSTFDDPWLAAAARSFVHGSPSSVAVTWAAAHKARHLSLAEVFRMELVLSVNFCALPDFREGVRALLVDKDRTPRWHRAHLSEVDDAWVARHFASPWSKDEHPLSGLGKGEAA